MNSHSDIRIGTLAGKGAQTPEYIRQILPHGFESFQINFWKTLGTVDLKKLSLEVESVLDTAHSDAVVSSLGMFGNPLVDANCDDGWKKCIDAAPLFGCNLVCGFAGRVVDKPIPDSMKRF